MALLVTTTAFACGLLPTAVCCLHEADHGHAAPAHAGGMDHDESTSACCADTYAAHMATLPVIMITTGQVLPAGLPFPARVQSPPDHIMSPVPPPPISARFCA